LFDHDPGNPQVKLAEDPSRAPKASQAHAPVNSQ
jgi:hypothetical protein